LNQIKKLGKPEYSISLKEWLTKNKLSQYEAILSEDGIKSLADLRKQKERIFSVNICKTYNC
jgi:hypothetical protein